MRPADLKGFPAPAKHSPTPWRLTASGFSLLDASGAVILHDPTAANYVADIALVAAQSARIAELEGALYRMCNLFLQEGPKDAYKWAGYQHARALLAKGEG